MANETVYKTFDNVNSIQVLKDSVAVDFSAVTRMKVIFQGSETVVDSSVDAAAIDWDDGGGVINFTFGDVALDGERKATLVAYDPAHTSGQIILDANIHALTFNFRDLS